MAGGPPTAPAKGYLISAPCRLEQGTKWDNIGCDQVQVGSGPGEMEVDGRR